MDPRASKPQELRPELKPFMDLCLDDYESWGDSSQKMIDISVDIVEKHIVIACSVTLLLTGILSAIMGHSFGLVLSVLLFFFGLGLTDCLAVFLHTRIGKSKLKGYLEKERIRAVRDRVALLEVKTGGIASAIGYVRTDHLSNEIASAWLGVLRKSANRETIDDIESYFDILVDIRRAFEMEENQAESKRIRVELDSITKSASK